MHCMVNKSAKFSKDSGTGDYVEWVILMRLTQNEKELLIRAFSFYYEKHVWNYSKDFNDNVSSDEDYAIRQLTDKLGIKNMFPSEISSRW